MRIQGIIPVLVSPMHEDGSPDHEGYRNLLRHLYRHPIGGLWMLGSASEDFLMSEAHRLEVTRLVSKHLDGRSPVIVGAGHPVLEATYRFFDDTADMKIAAYHLLPPDRKMKPSLAYRYCAMVADRAPKPIWLYSNEKRALKIPVEVVRDLVDHPNVAGIKAAGYDLADIVPFCMMNGEQFQAIGSGGGHLPVFLALGAEAHTASSACSFPGAYCAVYELWQQGRLDEARQRAFAISRLIRELPHPDNTEFCAEEKMVLELLGICRRHVHPPFRPCNEQEARQAAEVLERHGMLEAVGSD